MWEPNIGGAISLGQILQKTEGLCDGYWRDQEAQAGYWRDSGAGWSATGRVMSLD